MKPRCSHCGTRPSRRNVGGLCAACEAYERKYGAPPSKEVLIARARRQLYRRLADNLAEDG